MGPPLGDAAAHRQDRLGPLQGLALRFFVHAHHHGIVRGVQVEADDIAELGVQQRVGGELEPLRPVRLQAEPASQPGDRVMANLDLPGPAQPPGQPPARPVHHPGRTQSIRRRGHGRRQDLADRPLGQHPPRPAHRFASSSPASPSSAYCRRHLTTVGSVHPTRPAIATGPPHSSFRRPRETSQRRHTESAIVAR